MSRIAYVNGRYVAHRDARVHVEDRGYQFADGVYEVCEVLGGRIVDERRHMQRLQRSLSELAIRLPMPIAALGVIFREVVRRNRVHDGMIYLQVTRGVAPREHAFPSASVAPAIVLTAHRLDGPTRERAAADGVAVITVPEIRWARVDIKTVGLLANVLAKQKARDAGASEAWFVDGDGKVTEGASTNAWIVTTSGALVTRPAETGILRGVTRGVIFDLARREKLRIEERGFAVKEALAAAEAFLSASTTLVMPVVSIDGKPIGDGKPGPLATKLRRLLHSATDIAPAWSAANRDGPEFARDLSANSRQTDRGHAKSNAFKPSAKPRKREA